MIFCLSDIFRDKLTGNGKEYYCFFDLSDIINIKNEHRNCSIKIHLFQGGNEYD